MRKRIAALFLSITVITSGMTFPVMAEDFSDSAVVAEQDTEEEQNLIEFEEEETEAEETVEADADVSIEEDSEEAGETDPEAAENLLDDGEASIAGEEEEDLFTSEETVPDVGVIGGNIRWNYSGNIIPTEKSTADEGNILLGVKGSYMANAQAVLNLINQYRKEACDKGYPDPRDSSRRLTKSDYVPIKWSSDLEYIARIRAAEASVVADHVRPNGESCFSLESPNGIGSSGEVLAWNSGSEDITTGVKQWYGEKDTWVNQENGVTGHYTSMINPDNLYVGVSSFLNPDADPWDAGTWPYTSAGEFSRLAGLDETSGPAISDCTQIIEVQSAGLKPAVSFSMTSEVLRPGKTIQASLIYNVEGVPLVYVPNVSGNGGITWSSSNTKAASIDQNGKITAGSAGKTTITAATASGITASSALEVKKVIVNIADTDIWVPYPTYTGGNVKPSVQVKYEGETLKVGKDYTYTYTKASKAGQYIRITINGKGDYKGSVTGYLLILKKSVKNFTVKGISVKKTYTGKKITQKITVYDGKKKLKSSDYTVKYSSNKNPGKVTVKITGKGNYTGTITKTFNIVPGKMKKPSLKAGKKKVTVSFKKAAGVTGYQIAYSTNKRQYQYVNVSAKNSKAVLQNLSSKKNYYVKVRAYKTIDGKQYYGAYSPVSKVKAK